MERVSAELCLSDLGRPDWLLLLSLTEGKQVLDFAYGCLALDNRQLLVRHCEELTAELIEETNRIFAAREFQMIVVVMKAGARRPHELREAVKVMDEMTFRQRAHRCLNIRAHAN